MAVMVCKHNTTISTAQHTRHLTISDEIAESFFRN